MDRVPTAFHRTVFLFVSPQVDAAPRGLLVLALTLSRQGNQLQQPGAVRAFRSQLPRANQFYAFEPAGAPPQSSAVPARTGSERSCRAAEDDAAALGSATPAAVAGCVLTALSYSTSHVALDARWVDAAPFPEWELVTDEEPSDGAAAGGAAAELPTAEPAASLAPAATGSGDQEQARADVGDCAVAICADKAAQEEDGGEEDMADFEDSAEQAHFSAFTARVRNAALGCLASLLTPTKRRWHETLSRCCVTASTGSLRPCGHLGHQCL